MGPVKEYFLSSLRLTVLLLPPVPTPKIKGIDPEMLKVSLIHYVCVCVCVCVCLCMSVCTSVCVGSHLFTHRRSSGSVHVNNCVSNSDVCLLPCRCLFW